MKLPLHKTKIVCTIGPSSRSLPQLKDMINSGMNIARLNFSHGSFNEHSENIRNIRRAAAQLKRRVSIIIDLPGTKMRVGALSRPLQLKKGASLVLTPKAVPGSEALVPVDYPKLAQSVSRGGIIFLNDGFIQLKVESVKRQDVLCKVIVGGELLSHKGLNLPGAKRLFVDAITKRDLEFVRFGLQQGVATFGLSFVEKGRDVMKVREFARKLGKYVYLVAKIERREAIENFEEILKETDAVMIARGDLGVEVPLEEVPVIQKGLICKANAVGKPVIIATQMLESMTQNIRPTRAEVNDVANAILDGADAVMLSEETAIGDYPIETVQMMSKIAQATEYQRSTGGVSNDEGEQVRDIVRAGNPQITDVISLNVVSAAEELNVHYILSLTSSGSTARRISRFKPHCWILAFSAQSDTCDALAFSYGVHPFFAHKEHNQIEAILKNIKTMNLVKKGDIVILTERRLSPHPGETDSMAVVTI